MAGGLMQLVAYPKPRIFTYPPQRDFYFNSSTKEKSRSAALSLHRRIISNINSLFTWIYDRTPTPIIYTDNIANHGPEPEPLETFVAVTEAPIRPFEPNDDYL